MADYFVTYSPHFLLCNMEVTTLVGWVPRRTRQKSTWNGKCYMLSIAILTEC